LVDMQYNRNDQALARGTFRVRGESLEVFPSYAETAFRTVFFGDEIESVQHFDPLTGEVYAELEHIGIWPATHYATDRETIKRALEEIRDELETRCKELENEGKLLESHRLRQRTEFDMEMLRELGVTARQTHVCRSCRRVRRRHQRTRAPPPSPPPPPARLAAVLPARLLP